MRWTKRLKLFSFALGIITGSSSRAIASYDDAVGQMAEEDYSRELAAAQEYNRYLAEFSDLSSAAATENKREDSPCESLLDVGGSGC